MSSKALDGELEGAEELRVWRISEVFIDHSLCRSSSGSRLFSLQKISLSCCKTVVTNDRFEGVAIVLKHEAESGGSVNDVEGKAICIRESQKS